ncbi:MAG: 50S ribosomal protein L15 [Patescibacteria group bacterium]
MNISLLFSGIKNTKRHRVGRGIAGSGGKTAGRGTKGQNSRAGSGRKVQEWFEGGQTPLYRIQAKKRGFNHRVEKFQVISTDVINRHFKKGETVSVESLVEHGIIRRSSLGKGVKIIKRGELKEGVKLGEVNCSASLRT